jgi:hypothetical protein
LLPQLKKIDSSILAKVKEEKLWELILSLAGNSSMIIRNRAPLSGTVGIDTKASARYIIWQAEEILEELNIKNT